MKCWHITKTRKNKLSSIEKKELQQMVAEYVQNSLIVGPKKALDVMKMKDVEGKDNVTEES